MQLIENRKFIRHPLCMPLAYKVLGVGKKDDKEAALAQTLNVSLGGLLFSSKNMVKAGTRIVINMPFEDKMFKVKALVVRCTKNVETAFFDIAVSFQRIQEAFKVKMIEQIYLIAEFRDLLSLQSGKQVSLEVASKKWIKRYSARFKKLYW
jgi:c-di-GMP-binding flagellar brake protein YcgR